MVAVLVSQEKRGNWRQKASKCENLTSFFSSLPHTHQQMVNQPRGFNAVQLSLSPSFCKPAVELYDHLSRHTLSNISYELISVLALF